MKIHPIQTGTVAIKQRQRAGAGSGMMRLINTLCDREWTDNLPIYAWVIEHPEGLIVVDTGDTTQTSEPGYFPRWHPYYRFGVRMAVQPEAEIGAQMRKIGLSPNDVRWVVLTHLHTDHAGGLHHFPKSDILVSRREHAAAAGLAGRLNGYLPHRWPEWYTPVLVDFEHTPFAAFPQSHTLTQAGDVHLVPTPGHSDGHLSVILQSDNGLSYFFAGDVSYTQQFMLTQTVDGVTADIATAQNTLARTLAYVRSTPTIYLPSHDPDSANRLLNRAPVQMLAQAV